MRRLYYILLGIALASCSNDNAWDCIQNAGTIKQIEISVSDFEEIIVNRDIELIISQGADYKVIVESGENLLNDIEAKVVSGELQLTDGNNCNLVRDYGITKVYVTAPNLTKIRNSSQYTVSSIGTLTYPEILLISEDFNLPDSFTVGDFRMQFNNSKVQVVSNNISSFYLSGQTQDLNVGFFSGIGRFEGGNLVAQNVDVFHRGANDMIVNPQISLSGELRGTGNLIAVNQPPTVDVEQFYIGELIFED